MMTEVTSTERVHVELGERSYDILIGRRLLDSIATIAQTTIFGSHILIACDEAVQSPWGKVVYKALSQSVFDVTIYPIPRGEGSKSSQTLFEMWDVMADGGFSRDSGIVALGGGVAGDLAGFAAASFLRGIPYIQIPTTLLSMVDSSVGGKTGINLSQGKNLVGAFWQPRCVVADLDCLGTLPEGEKRAGMAEVIKYGVIRDAEFFTFLEEHADEVFQHGETEALARIIRRSVEIKADVVGNDERESGERAILNFGHTIGHAVEAEAHFGGIRHGEAVAIGMVAASALTLKVGHGNWSMEDHERLMRLIERTQLPTRIPDGMSIEALVERTKHDKKVKRDKVRYVLPTRMGAVELVRDVPEDAVRSVLHDLGAR